MGEGVGRSKDVQAGSRRAAARSTDPTQHPAHKGQPGQCKGNGHKAKKANKVGISERDNSRMGNIAGLRIAKSRVRIPARAASPEPELGPRSSVLGPRSSVLGPRSSVLGPRSSVLGPRLFGAVGASLFSRCCRCFELSCAADLTALDLPSLSHSLALAPFSAQCTHCAH
jgi:hypothetical protein